MSETVSVMLTGDVLPGHGRDAVGAALAKLLNISEDSAAALLSGSQTVVKRNVPAADADRYVRALERAGAGARIDVAQAPSAVPERVDTPAPAPLTAVVPPQAASAVTSPYAVTPGAAHSVDELDEETVTPSVFGLSTAGRVGRLRYLAYAWPVMAVAFVGGVLGALTMPKHSALGGILLIPIGIAVLWLSIRILVMRLHDVNLSGKWLLLLFVLPAVAGALQMFSIIPIVMGLFWLAVLVLILWPGSAGTNSYGPPCGPNTTWVRVGAVAFIIFQVLGIVINIGMIGMGKSYMLGPKASTAPSAFDGAAPGGHGLGRHAVGRD